MFKKKTNKTAKVIVFHGARAFHVKHITHIKKHLIAQLSQEGFVVAEIHFWFMDNTAIRKINREHLRHDYTTDVITFEHQSRPIIADVCIGGETIIANARIYRARRFDEFLRVFCHAMLHIVGYKDKTPQERKIMQEKEEQWMKAFHVKHKVK